MRSVSLAIVLVLFGSMKILSQTYYEASGQTATFTLTAGAKSGFSAIHSSSPMRTGMNNAVTVASTKGAIVITLTVLPRGSVDIALYNIVGRQMYRHSGLNGTSLRIDTQSFAPGIYVALVRIEGQSYPRRFVVNRQGY